MVALVTPYQRNWRSTISRIGISPIGTSGFGNATVYGARRVPRPPASTTARTSRSNCVHLGAVAGQVAAHPIDDAAQALVQRDARLPAGEATRQRGIGQ